MFHVITLYFEFSKVQLLVFCAQRETTFEAVDQRPRTDLCSNLKESTNPHNLVREKKIWAVQWHFMNVSLLDRLVWCESAELCGSGLIWLYGLA